MINIKNDLKKWKNQIRECEKEYLKKNKYIYYNYNCYENKKCDNTKYYNNIDNPTNKNGLELKKNIEVLLEDDEYNKYSLEDDMHIIKMERNLDSYKRKVRYRILLGVLLFLCLVYSIIDMIFINK